MCVYGKVNSFAKKGTTRPGGHYINKEWLCKENGVEKCAAALETLLYLQKHTVPKIQNKKYFSLKLKNKRLL